MTRLKKLKARPQEKQSLMINYDKIFQTEWQAGIIIEPACAAGQVEFCSGCVTVRFGQIPVV